MVDQNHFNKIFLPFCLRRNLIGKEKVWDILNYYGNSLGFDLLNQNTPPYQYRLMNISKSTASELSSEIPKMRNENYEKGFIYLYQKIADLNKFNLRENYNKRLICLNLLKILPFK
jgi:hypothetical protein